MSWILHPDQITEMLGITAEEVEDLGLLDDSYNQHALEKRHRRLKRPHTKSRRGCLNCKRRKIKCQETKPACDNCVSRDMKCAYVSPELEKDVSETSSTSDTSLITTRTPSPHPFTGEDLRFFQHFLLVSRPHLPFGSEDAWTTVIPAQAHECSHLMHAVLALGATHYSLITPHDPQYKVMAISHRGKALQKVSRALENIDTCSASSLDAILATCYALTFQAYYMNDGMIDFAVMVRGCSLITGHIQRRFKSSKMFLLQTKEEVLQLVEPWLSEAPHPNLEALSLCIRDIEELHPFLADENARGFFNAIHKTYVTLQTSIRNSFECLSEVYSIWYSMGNEDFNAFISSENTICRALFLHYLAIETLMRPFLLEIRGPKHPTLSFGAIVIQQWADAAYESLPASLQVLVKHEVDLISLEK